MSRSIVNKLFKLWSNSIFALFQIENMLVDDVRQCAFPTWYPTYQKITFPRQTERLLALMMSPYI